MTCPECKSTKIKYLGGQANLSQDSAGMEYNYCESQFKCLECGHFWVEKHRSQRQLIPLYIEGALQKWVPNFHHQKNQNNLEKNIIVKLKGGDAL